MNLEFAVAIRERLPRDNGFRPSFLGHILVELLLDAVLIEDAPARLGEYYRAMDSLNPELVARAVNRIYRGDEGRQNYLVNLGRELMDAFWLLTKLANRFDVDLDEEAQRFTRRMGTWSPSTVKRYRAELIASLRMLDEDLSAAKRELGLD